MNTAESWISTDTESVKKDVARLGLDGATEYQMGLIADRSAVGDKRWDSVTEQEMREALKAFEFSEYTVRLSSDPSYYGVGYTDDDCRRIANDIANLIRGEFPGINVDVHNMIGSSATTGPCSETIREIDGWVQENWTSAL
jgi:hypothetical protein